MGDFDGITVDGKSVEECIETEKSKDIRKTLEQTLSSQIKILPKIGKIKFPEVKESNSKVRNYTKAEIRGLNMKKGEISSTHKIMNIFRETPNHWLGLNEIVNLTKFSIPKGTISGILSRIKLAPLPNFECRKFTPPRKGFEYRFIGPLNLSVEDLVKDYNSKILKRFSPKKPSISKKDVCKKDIVKEVIDNNSILSAQYLIEFIEGLKRMGLKVDININITS